MESSKESAYIIFSDFTNESFINKYFNYMQSLHFLFFLQHMQLCSIKTVNKLYYTN